MIARSQRRHVFHLDDHSSESTAYIGFYPDSYPSGSPLKDGGSPTMTARSQPKQVFTLTAARVSQQPISGPTLTAIPRGAPER